MAGEQKATGPSVAELEASRAQVASAGNGTASKFIGVPEGYKANPGRRVAEFDILGRMIVEDNVPIQDNSRFVHRSVAQQMGTGGDVDRDVNTMEPGRWEQTRTPRPAARAPLPAPFGRQSPGYSVMPPGLNAPPQGDVVENRFIPGGWAAGGATGDGTGSNAFRTKIVNGEDVTPRYLEGMQYDPAKKMPSEIAELQRRMVDAGALPKTFKRFGFWDLKSQNAYKDILGYANQSGVDADEMIRRWKEYNLGESGDTVPGKELKVANPEDVAALVKQTSGRVLGRTLGDAEVQRIVRSYQDIDRAEQEAIAAASEAAAAGQDVTVPDAIKPETYMENQVRQQNQGEADWFTAQGRMKSFFSMLGPAVPGAGQPQ